MAIATSKTVLVDPPQPAKVKRKRIVLELSVNEAETLQVILSNVGGIPKDTRRKYASTILNALEEAGVECPDAVFDKGTFTSNSIFFDTEQDNPEKD